VSLDDKYTYPGSGGVLRNNLNIRDPYQLDDALNDFASATWAAMTLEGSPLVFDFSYLQRIHHRLFHQVLPFAGQVRDVDVQAIGTGVPYCRPDYIHANLDTLFAHLKANDYLRGLPGPQFAVQLADHWAELTAIHPFRDGNTRSQSAYVSMLALSAGHPIAWSRVNVNTLRTLRLRGVTTTTADLAAYLLDVTSGHIQGPRLIFAQHPDDPSDPGRNR